MMGNSAWDCRVKRETGRQTTCYEGRAIQNQVVVNLKRESHFPFDPPPPRQAKGINMRRRVCHNVEKLELFSVQLKNLAKTDFSRDSKWIPVRPPDTWKQESKISLRWKSTTGRLNKKWTEMLYSTKGYQTVHGTSLPIKPPSLFTAPEACNSQEIRLKDHLLQKVFQCLTCRPSVSFHVPQDVGYHS